jgi:hypothetical protein
MNPWKSLGIGVVVLAGSVLLPTRSWAQYPVYYYRQPAYYAPPQQPRQLGPSAFVGSSYAFAPPATPGTVVQYFEPTYSSFYDPRLNPPRYAQPGPYWYTRSYPYSPTYYSYYDTPGYFRY